MRLIPVSSLNPGFKIARSVYNSNGQVLLSAGTKLTVRFIKKLKRLGIQRIYVDDGLLPDIEIEDVILEETRKQAVSRVKAFMTGFGPEKKITVKKAAVVCRDMMDSVIEITDQLMVNRSMLVNMQDIRTYDEYTFGHSVNVCVLSLLAGINLGYDPKRLVQLGLGAIMHDIGKTLVPAKIINKPERLTPDEFEEVKKHCQYGAKLIKQAGFDGALVSAVALQHHERHNGEGYPRGIKEDRIHEFARIVAVADTYDAITSDRVYKKASLPHVAYEMLAGSGDYDFDYSVVNAFLHNIAAYPTGTFVELNTGELGAVVETFRGNSLHPRVRVLFAPDGSYMENCYEISLHEEPGLSIIRVLDDLDCPTVAVEELRKNIG
ncbi:MAG: phosphodiesterase [Peptococcaceae bacterium BRH_c4b]|nr:MAG: phosphodiesterase [Peptococcaceae bacterium BRH_c4b]